MSIHDAASQRLYLASDLATGLEVACSDDQANYLRRVLRVADGASLLVFNGRDGEWQATLGHIGKRCAQLRIETLVRPQVSGPDIVYLFAPLKRSRLDYMVQKATEMGVARLCPVLTRRTIAERVNTDRMRANVIEAAEQCGILRVPVVDEPVKLDKLLAGWDLGRHLIVCDEAAAPVPPLQTLAALPTHTPLAVLIGPEGGFAAEERAVLQGHAAVTCLSLGPRIMRADTAAVAALALINATRGDWTT
jgi:16S rRNA (uracil1498-N3)-methyltransferase